MLDSFQDIDARKQQAIAACANGGGKSSSSLVLSREQNWH